MKQVQVQTSLIWAGALVFLATVAAITALILRGNDPSPLVAFLGGVPAAVIGVAGFIKSQKIESKVDTVSSNVNGHLTALAQAAGIPKAIPPTDATGGTP